MVMMFLALMSKKSKQALGSRLDKTFLKLLKKLVELGDLPRFRLQGTFYSLGLVQARLYKLRPSLGLI